MNKICFRKVFKKFEAVFAFFIIIIENINESENIDDVYSFIDNIGFVVGDIDFIANNIDFIADDVRSTIERDFTSVIIEEIHRDNMLSNSSFFDWIDFNDVQRRKLAKIIVFVFVVRDNDESENDLNSNFNFSSASKNRDNNNEK